MAGVKTYDPKKVIVVFGSVNITGFDEGTFVQIETQGDGTTAVVGCDQEVVRSISPQSILKKIVITLLQSSDSNDKLSSIQDSDNQSGNGVKALSIKDLSGRTLMKSSSAWIVKKPQVQRGKSAGDGKCAWEFLAVVPDDQFVVGGHT